MSFEITPLNFWEIDTYIHLRYHTFANSDSSLNSCFIPNGYTAPVHYFLRRSAEKALSDPNALVTFIRDPSSSRKVVGAMSWEFQHAAKPIADLLAEEAHAAEERAAQAPVEGVNHGALNAFREIQARVHRETMRGQPHAYLGILVVDGENQRRGVGRAALEWALRKVDEMGLPAYLEGTAAGKRLYESCGFETRVAFPFDARKWGSEREVVHYVMVRPAKVR